MRLDHFHKEARKQTELFQKDPKSYRRHLFWFATLGFLYPILVALMVLFILLIAAWGAYKLLYDLNFSTMLWFVATSGLAVTGMVIRPMFLPVPKPDGHQLAINEAPKLFELVEEVRQKLDAPKIQSIYLTNEFNMAVVRRPLFGFFGPAENILIVGLWMIEAMSIEEIRSVIAHELGHLSRKHNRVTFWFFKLWQMWDHVIDPHGDLQGKAELFKGFINWYGPRFHARAMVLRKAYELEADRFGMTITDSGTVLREHIKIGIGSAAMEKVFWPAYFSDAYDMSLPPRDTFELVVSFLTTLENPALLSVIRNELVQTSMPYDTHPSTCERLTYLKFEIPTAQTALTILSEDKTLPRASSLFSNKALEHYRDYYNRLLKAALIAQWRQKHQEAEDAKKKRDALHGKTTLSETEKWELAYFQYKYTDKERICDSIRNFLCTYPNHPKANCILGEWLLKEDDEKGIAYIEKAMSGDSYLITDGLQALSKFSERRVDDAKLTSVMVRWDQHIKNVNATNKDRSRINSNDELENADVSEQDRDSIRKILSHYGTIKEAYLVRKKVRIFSDKPCYILAVYFIRKLMRFDFDREQILVNCLYSDLSKIDGINVCSMNNLSRVVIRKIRSVEKSKIWPV
ncbi:MAG: M48 family metallopeptidase [Planctomycetota bacterium]